ncbi:MAG: AAA family ATPase [Burkholderiales bacterium]|nr:AAA family ATPase [Burkholderiales bacterium]
MYLEHYGLAEPPFRITPHTEFFYQGANRGATLEALQYAVLHGEGLVKVTGEVGAGKTMLCRVLMERLPEQVDTVYLANPSMSREEILLTIAADLHLPLQEGRSSVLIRELQEALIERFAAGRQVVVLIDEAHAMPEESLEEVRLLSNLEHGHHKLLQIVLFGQPELDTRLATQSMRQLRERITHGFELAPLRQTDIGEYLMFRMRTAGYKGPDIFTQKAIRLIAEESEGLTRRINILADKSLIASFAAGRHQVDAVEAAAAIKDSGFRRVQRTHWRMPAAAAALLLLGVAGGVAATRLTADGGRPVAAAQPATVLPKAAPPAVAQSSARAGPAVAQTPRSAPVSATPAPQPAQGADESDPQHVFDARLDASRPAFDKQAPQNYTVLLSVAPRAQKPALAQLMAQTARKLSLDELYLYPTVTRRGVEVYGLTYGFFPDQSHAAAALAKLPPELRNAHPMLRTVGGILTESRGYQKTNSNQPFPN